ncbi:radical SAM protein, partial [Elusimicrobiota bacterium]
MKAEKNLINWTITRACNYKCKYCKDYTGAKVKPHAYLQNMIEILRQTEKKWVFEISGGEPFLYPDFTDLCVTLSKEFQLEILTNLSLSDKVRDFSGKIDPSKVRIRATVHIEELERRDGIEAYVKNRALLVEKGFSVISTYVMYPALVKRFKKDFDRFLSHGIRLFPTVYKGWYKMRMYPRAYTSKERNLIIKYNPKQYFYPFCFKDKICSAGVKYVRVDESGIVARCVNDKTVLGNMAESVR